MPIVDFRGWRLWENPDFRTKRYFDERFCSFVELLDSQIYGLCLVRVDGVGVYVLEESVLQRNFPRFFKAWEVHEPNLTPEFFEVSYVWVPYVPRLK